MIKILGLSGLAKSLKAQKDKIIEDLIEKLVDNTPIDTGEARLGWHREGDAIVNRVEHINILNQGHSQQAPAYFVESTVMKTPALKPNGIIVKEL